MQSTSASYRPNPLSFNSPRASPFRRPESPSSPSPLRHSTTPTTSPVKQAGTPSPSKLNHSNSPATDAETWKPRGLVASVPPYREPPTSPTRGADSPKSGSTSTMATARLNTSDMNAVSKLQPAPSTRTTGRFSNSRPRQRRHSWERRRSRHANPTR